MDAQTKITLGIAIYGAFLATATLIWNLTQPLRENPKLKIKSFVGIASYGETYPVFSIEAINIGRIPVTLSSGGLYFSKNQTMFFLEAKDGFPKDLYPGKNHIVFRPLNTFIKDLIKKEKDIGEPIQVWFKDQIGKEYTGKIINLSRFIKEEKLREELK